jgi:ATP-dependent Clp protease ATP-binding subunit ClpC
MTLAQKTITAYKNLFVILPYFFSVTSLTSTFFVPWKRYQWTKTTRGLDVSESIFVALSNLFSIFLGVVLRSIVLFVFAMVFISAVVFGLPICFFTALFFTKSVLFYPEEIKKTRSLAWDWHYGFTPLLDQFSKELYYEQETGFFLGRKQELSVLTRVLYSQEGNNLMLIGDSGMGRHALLAEASKEYINKRFMVFDYVAFFKSIPTQNERSGKLQEVLKEAKRAGNIVLILYNFEELIPYTSLFEEYFQSPELHIVGVATKSSYNKHILTNDEIMKYFSTLQLPPLSHEELIEIVASYSAQIHKKPLPADTISLVVDVSDNYASIERKHQPEAAISLLSDFFSYHENTLSAKHYCDMRKELVEFLQSKLNIPVTFATQGEKQLLKNLEHELGKQLVNQRPALSQISNALRRSRMALTDNKKPIGSFLFLGPTGVGKTQTAKILAKLFFGSEDRMIRFDMATFASLSKSDSLVESITAEIRTKPYGVLLLDELEKAEQSIQNLLLTMLDEGYIQDTLGTRISCSNLIIIATSNAGSEFIRERITEKPNLEQVPGNPNLSQLAVDYILRNNIFSPEFLNRFNAVVVFTPLSTDQLKEITRMKLVKLQKLLEEKHNQKFEITEMLINQIVEVGYKPEFGARELDRAIDEVVTNKLAMELIG